MLKIGLIGNPNSGKSSVFNVLTGMRQKVGNYPGVTVEIHSGFVTDVNGNKVEIFDFPGSYSLHSNTSDEFLLTEALLNEQAPYHPDAIVYVADITLLDNQLLLLTQLSDLKFPILVCLSNCDQVNREFIPEYVNFIEQKFSCPCLALSTKTNLNVDLLKSQIAKSAEFLNGERYRKAFITLPNDIEKEFERQQEFRNSYQFYLWKHYGFKINPGRIGDYFIKEKSLRLQIEETMSRYNLIEHWTSDFKKANKNISQRTSLKIDHWLTHPILGAALFTCIMFFVFQAIFSWASIPMDFIESGFAYLQGLLGETLPQGWLSDLMIKGLLPGLSGVLVFIPQIALLFFLISWMEELGYMARVVYMFDHILRKFGLNGRSLVGLISGGACAIPAILSTRNINNKRDRLVTMFVIPLIPCSARIPVYTALIGFVIPYEQVFGVFNNQGIVFMGLYCLGIFMALITAAIIRYFIKSEELSYLVLQLPDYRWPSLKNVLLVVYEKVKSFVVQAGAVILIISMVLWFLASFSWSGEMQRVESEMRSDMQSQQLDPDVLEAEIEAKLLEHSFAGQIGKLIEPVFAPLGFDWKISISLITSFAAREVFVGTMSTIYSLGSSEDEVFLRQKMGQELRSDGSKFYDAKTSLSLILFYAFAMQCMSTFAVMWKETKSRKWPVIQFVYMGALAYISSWLVYQFF
ncbi:MAG: ferrous iron transport protein B [Saprospiraceae bacterium]|nr:ferrous iron transport protein B [Saprospiraceae bacterium]